jgi:prevent-host-death family protein
MAPNIPTETVQASEARAGWAGLLKRVFRREARLVIEKSGIPVAVLISPDDFELFQFLLAKRAEQFNAIDALRAAFRDEPSEEIECEVEKALTEVRAEQRARATAVPGDRWSERRSIPTSPQQGSLTR